MQRRRLPLGFFPDRGLADPITLDSMTDVPGGGVGVLAQILIPRSTQLMVTSALLEVAETMAGGTRDGYDALAFFVRREGNGVPSAVTQIGTQLVIAGIANVSAAVIALPDGTYKLSIVQTSALNAQRVAARFTIGAVPII